MKCLKKESNKYYITNWFTLTTCVLIHFFIVTNNNWICYSLDYFYKTIWIAAQGVGFLMYPILGWIADVYITRYRMIKISYILVLSSSLLMLSLAIPLLLRQNKVVSVGSILAVIIIMVGIMGYGMYESNAIQFGMDQMLEASSEKLSSFIHWYYWSLHLGELVIFYIIVIFLSYVHQHCVLDLDNNYEALTLLGMIQLLPSIIQSILIVIGLYVMNKQRKHIFINPVRINPFKMILSVILFARKHKYPVNRSAFTYWENDIPSRIDLGKHKYGGPFTNEQVDDVKTLLQLSIFIISLFGFQLSGDGYSLREYMMNNLGCPTIWTLQLLVLNPKHVTLLVILIGIPLYQFIIKKYFAKYTPILLKRIYVGLFICLIREGIYPFISLLIGSREHTPVCNINEFNSSNTADCFLVNIKIVVNGTCGRVCPAVPAHDNLFLLLIIPQLLHGIAYLLVFMTVLEFICAQAPYTMKGLLIGIWYATLSIKYLVVDILDGYMVEENSWNIYHGVKGFGIFLSIVSFSFVCKFYHYRERNEIVNEQAIIEKQYERELLHNRGQEEEEESEQDELTQLLNYNQNINRP